MSLTFGQVLIHILASIETLPLLQLRLVAHRFQNVIIRLVHARLLRAASLKDRSLILEAYHPSQQYTEPYVYCDYLGTPGLSDDVEGKGPIYQIAEGHTSRGTLRRLYSRFRPTRKDPQQYAYRSHPAGDIPGTRTSDRAESLKDKAKAEVVIQNVNLDAHELFTQLRLMASLVQVGPSRGFFLSIESIVENKTTRLWRHWLAGAANSSPSRIVEDSHQYIGDMDTDTLVWVDQTKVAGLKVRVKERTSKRDVPILLHRDEDPAVNYSLELEGESLFALLPLCTLVLRLSSLRCSRTGHQHYAPLTSH